MANIYAPQNWQLWGINRAKITKQKTKPQKNCDLVTYRRKNENRNR